MKNLNELSENERWQAIGYWEWAKTAPRCLGCKHPFSVENARACRSPDPQRFCCEGCALLTMQREASEIP